MPRLWRAARRARDRIASAIRGRPVLAGWVRRGIRFGRQLRQMPDVWRRVDAMSRRFDNLERSVAVGIRRQQREIAILRRKLESRPDAGEMGDRDPHPASNFDATETGRTRRSEPARPVSATAHAALRPGAEDTQIRINLADGTPDVPGYLNVGTHERHGIDFVGDWSAPLPFARSTVTELRIAHVLQSAGTDQLRESLTYWASLLKPGGILRAIIVDADSAIHAYAGRHLAFEELQSIMSPTCGGSIRGLVRPVAAARDLLAGAGFVGVTVQPAPSAASRFEVELTATMPVMSDAG